MMDDGKGKTQAAQPKPVWVCPSCKKTVHISRRYCNCHTGLIHADIKESADRPAIGPCNFETEGLNCGDCPEDCMYCFGFGLPKTNKFGFGGTDCRHNNGTTRCYCCQAQVKVAIKLSETSFSEIVRDVTEKRRAARDAGEEAGEVKNRCFEIADTIRDMMTERVQARINHVLAG
jgi:predicted CopG family antitoxin